MYVRELIIHCADTPDGVDVPMAEIDRWHYERGFLRSVPNRNKFNDTLLSIGYHFVISPDGEIHTGRAEDEMGAHCLGHNFWSLGICLIGRSRFTRAQWRSLGKLIPILRSKYRIEKITGHYEYSPKSCPNFDVHDYIINGKPRDENVLAVTYTPERNEA